MRDPRRLVIHGRRSVAVGLLVLSAAFPFRFTVGGSALSLSVFDVTVAVLSVPYLVLLARRRMEIGSPAVFALCAGLLLLDALSLLWSRDVAQTARSVLSSAEALLVYLMVVGFLARSVTPVRVVRIMMGWALLLLVPAALLWLRVPGFLPPPGLDPTQGDYLSYFARLSHPFIGRSNNLATLLVFPLIPLAYWASTRRDPWTGAAAALVFVATVLTFSRGVLAALVIGFVIYLVLDRAAARAAVRRIAPAFVAGLVLVAAVVTFVPAVARFLPSRLSLANLTDRGELVGTGLDDLAVNPVLGIGGGVGVAVHNTYLQQFVAFGLVGGVLALVLFYRAGRCWFIAEPAGPLRGARRAAGAAVVVHLLVFATQASYEGMLLKPLIWLWWALAVAFVAATARDSPPEPTDAGTGAAADRPSG